MVFASSRGQAFPRTTGRSCEPRIESPVGPHSDSCTSVLRDTKPMYLCRSSQLCDVNPRHNQAKWMHADPEELLGCSSVLYRISYVLFATASVRSFSVILFFGY